MQGQTQPAQRVVARRWVISRRARLIVGLAATLTGLFVVMAFLLRRAAGTAADLEITTRVQAVEAPGLTPLMVAISLPGYWPWSSLAFGVLFFAFWLAGFRREALFLFGTPGAGLLSGFAKLLVERPRPTGPDVRVLSQLFDYSYPSGHVVGYVSLFGFVFFLVYVLFKRSWWRTALLIALGLLIGLVGLSRIYVGHHWVSDIVGGYALGSAYLVLLVEVYRLTTVKPTEPKT